MSLPVDVQLRQAVARGVVGEADRDRFRWLFHRHCDLEQLEETEKREERVNLSVVM